ncbi:ATPase domain-containing protein [Nodosilinea nodulosa]|uniref:ATPase domain-containing protein n=1 Tax=Nodosilinea nodulosa TaxID=416001 RepID=UPI0002DA4C79|nr:ATPase domain-containing protein [Nodosilinea nodulosa]
MTQPDLLSSGIEGLDEVLDGGLPSGQAYLVRGGPGCGKTTLGWHFLTHNLDDGGPRLFITLGESHDQLRRNAAVSGFPVEAVEILDLSPDAEFFVQNQGFDIFSAAQVEQAPLTERIVAQVNALRPRRVFIDSMTQLRYLSTDAYQFRQQAVGFLRFLIDAGATVLFTSEGSQEAPDEDLQFISDGIITLQMQEQGRHVQVSKLRGSSFRKGRHAMRIGDRGMVVFPQLVVGEQLAPAAAVHQRPAGIPEIDELLSGGLESGTVTIISGPSGVGKTTLGLQFIKEAAGRGDRSVVYLFEEAVDTLLNRCEGINIPVRAMVDRGTLAVIKVDPLLYSPDEFANQVRLEVEKAKTQIIMIDSVLGYKLSFREDDLIRNIHGLCQYLKAQGVTTLLTNEVESITGDFKATELGVSYLADNIVFLRYLEIRGQMRRAIGVLKKRLSDFEKTLREFEISRYGIKVGRPLTQLRGILSGVPEFITSSNDEP